MFYRLFMIDFSILLIYATFIRALTYHISVALLFLMEYCALYLPSVSERRGHDVTAPRGLIWRAKRSGAGPSIEPHASAICQAGPKMMVKSVFSNYASRKSLHILLKSRYAEFPTFILSRERGIPPA